jgi:hypothetical protein
MGIFPDGPPYEPGTLTLRGIVDGKPVEQVFQVDQGGIVQPPMPGESYTLTVTHADEAEEELTGAQIIEAEERHAVEHALYQVNRATPDDPECVFDYELVAALLRIIDRGENMRERAASIADPWPGSEGFPMAKQDRRVREIRKEIAASIRALP